ncbi:hypothetical protein CYLTODRAFT_484819 [Cylindrobasidium torrendii FP15055 ss-10]|uniref:BTB domain-containing protein n=1 Tax=Cylindrobasidium torrendii FP15055 ss-10 TaxID=1314674 RepID=A0A0D7BV58_9AGAR|nr:hypothetical protein CYLTODRAFT_484819 [Cylindrobasidium torrendii FP15055 ss-10]
MSSSGTRTSHLGHAAKKQSLSNFKPMHQVSSSVSGWLTRNGSDKGTIKSSHKPTKSIEVLSPRFGALGTGATVVRTPDEALKDSGILLDERTRGSPTPSGGERQLPMLPTEVESDGESEQVGDYVVTGKATPPPPRPTRSPPLCPRSDSSTSTPLVLAPDLTAAPPRPPFHVILLSDAPPPTVDRSKVIVSLETCTTTYRTTLTTLLSQPSYLAEYLLSLFPQTSRRTSAESLYSTDSEGDDEEQNTQDMYRHHLRSQGLLSDTKPFVIFLFLDRPSVAYPHILSYLRTGMFPRVSNIEQLLELRDEAAFLDYGALHDLCVEAIDQNSAVRRAPLVRSLHASVHSLHALLESTGPAGSRSTPDLTQMAKPSSSRTSNTSAFKPPPTPESWNSNGHPRSSAGSHEHIHGSIKVQPSRPHAPPPAGWI